MPERCGGATGSLRRYDSGPGPWRPWALEAEPAVLSVVRSFLALGSGEAIGRLVAFGAYLFLARALGPDSYGVIAFAAGLTLYLTKFADFAIEAVGSGEVARDPRAIARLAGPILSLRLAVAVGLLVVSTAVVAVTFPEPDRTILPLYFLSLIPVALSTKWIHMGLEQALPVGVWRVVSDLVFGGLVLAFVRAPGDMWVVPLALVAGEGLGTAALYLRLKMEGRSLGLVWDPAVALPVFRRAAPLVGQILLGLLLYNLDVVFLRVLIGSDAVGYYAAAYMLISFLANIGMVYGLSLLPALARETEADEAHGERFVSIEMYHTALAHVFAATLPVAVGGTFVALGVMRVGFGDAYYPSVLVLQVLVWVVPVAVFRNVPWSALIARDRQDLLMRATLYAVLLNAVLNLVLVPTVGMVGAALATLMAEPLACGLMLYHAQKCGLPIVPLGRLIKPGVAVTAMAVALWWLDTDALLPQLALGVVVYAAALALLGGLRVRRGLPVLEV